MDLYTLTFGKSKKRMHPIMTDSHKKCENYMVARGNVLGFHKIVPAEKGATVWRQKSATRNACLVGAITGVNVSGFWQALGLLILSGLLFKSSSSSSSK